MKNRNFIIFEDSLFNIIFAKTAFTLPETLITLSIIGIVAAMTLPVLQTKIQQEAFKNRWKKAYAEINQAYLMVQAQEDLSSYWECSELYCFNPVVNKILEQYKHINPLKNNTEDNIHPVVKEIKYKTVLGKEFTAYPTLHYAGSVNDMTIYYWSYKTKGAAIWVDVNSYHKLPNTLGKDVFALEIIKNKIYPFGQFATGDWCQGMQGSLNISYGQNNGSDPVTEPDDPNFSGDGIIDKTNYAGLGCSYEYLYGKSYKN